MSAIIFFSRRDSRGHAWMKSLATKVRIEFFSVTIPFGMKAVGSSTGKTLISL